MMLRLKMDGKLIKAPINVSYRPRVLLYHKPIGYMCTRNDEKDRSIVFEQFPPLKQGAGF